MAERPDLESDRFKIVVDAEDRQSCIETLKLLTSYLKRGNWKVEGFGYKSTSYLMERVEKSRGVVDG